MNQNPLAPATFTFADIPESAARYETSRFVLIPAGYDRTTSYGSGAHRGPAAIFEAAKQVELYDEELRRNTYLDGIWVCRSPELSAEGPHRIVESTAELVEAALRDGKIPVILGGEHTVSLGGIQACQAAHTPLTVVQIDAHADLRDQYEGSPYSHACVMRRAADMGCRLVQIGIRSLSEEEAIWLDHNPEKSRIHYARDIVNRPDPTWIRTLAESIRTPVYLTIDIDGLDPSIAPATGTPEPGGLSWYQTLQVLRELCRANTIIGFDLVELSPIPGFLAPDYLAARLLYRLMGYVSLGSKLPSLASIPFTE